MTSSAQERANAIREEEMELALRPLQLPAALSLSDLAALMDVGPIEVIKEFMRSGHMLTINDVVEHEVAAEITPMFGYRAVGLDEPETARAPSSSRKRTRTRAGWRPGLPW